MWADSESTAFILGRESTMWSTARIESIAVATSRAISDLLSLFARSSFFLSARTTLRPVPSVVMIPLFMMSSCPIDVSGLHL